MKGILFIVFVTIVTILFTHCDKKLSNAAVISQDSIKTQLNIIKTQLIQTVPGDLVQHNSGAWSIVRINDSDGKNISFINCFLGIGSKYTYDEAAVKIKKIISYWFDPIQYARVSFEMNGGVVDN